MNAVSRLAQARSFRTSNGILVSKEVKEEIAKLYGEITQLQMDLSLLQSATDRDESLKAHEKSVIKAQDKASFEEAKSEILAKIYKLDPEQAKGTSEKILEQAALAIGKAQNAAIKSGATVGVVASPVRGLLDGFRAGMKTKMPDRNKPEFHVA